MLCKQILFTSAFVLALSIFMCRSAAETVLLDEDFQDPLYSSQTFGPTFSGWSYTSLKAQSTHNTTDIPGDNYPAETNQVIRFEYTDWEIWYNTTYGWETNKAFTLTLKCSPQSWSGTLDRYIEPSIRQTDGTVLWSTSELMPKYDNFGRNPWTTSQEFTWIIRTDDFSTGQTGETVQVYLDSSGARGIYIDDVYLWLTPHEILNLSGRYDYR